MDELYSKLTYFFSTLSGSVSGFLLYLSDFSLYDWGFLVGLIVSILLGVLNYRLNRREQVKRTRILARYFARHQSHGKAAEEDAKKWLKAAKKTPKDV